MPSIHGESTVRATATSPRIQVDAHLKECLLDSVGEAVIATDLNGRILYWNDAATRLYGWHADEVVGTDVLDITASDGSRENATRIMAALRQGRSWSGEFTTRHRDGHEIPAVVTNRPVYDTDGELVGIVGISRDLSGERDAESALQASEERLDLVRRAAQSVIWELDPATLRVEWSTALGDVFGYAPEDVGSTLDWWHERIHPDDRPRLERGFRSFLESETHHFWTEEYRFRRADGSYADVFDRAYASPSRMGAKGRVAGAIVDLTERRRMQDERRLLAQASMILDLSLDYEATLPTLARLVSQAMADFCLIQLVPGTHIPPFTAAAHADPARQRALDSVAGGFAPTPPGSSIAGQLLRDREPRLFRNLPDALREGPEGPEPMRDLVLQLGPSSLMAVPVQARSEVIGFLILGSTALRAPLGEAELRMADELARRIGAAVDHARLYEAEQLANRAKADFLAVMSHELRTPLTAVLGYAELLADEISGPLNPEQKQQVQRIRAGTDRLYRLMESILAFVRLETGQERPGPVDVALADILDRAREIVAPRAAEEDLAFSIEVGEVPERIFTDPDRLLQVLLALLTNAVKFAREGSISLRVSWEDAEPDGAGTLLMEVSDTGPGIPAELQPYVFNAFWQVEQPSTRRAGGAGLGLSVARRLARLLGGDVVIRDSSPAGTTFLFHLPTHLPG